LSGAGGNWSSRLLGRSAARHGDLDKPPCLAASPPWPPVFLGLAVARGHLWGDAVVRGLGLEEVRRG
jgi:hypothetical protein